MIKLTKFLIKNGCVVTKPYDKESESLTFSYKGIEYTIEPEYNGSYTRVVSWAVVSKNDEYLDFGYTQKELIKIIENRILNPIEEIEEITEVETKEIEQDNNIMDLNKLNLKIGAKYTNIALNNDLIKGAKNNKIKTVDMVKFLLSLDDVKANKNVDINNLALKDLLIDNKSIEKAYIKNFKTLTLELKENFSTLSDLDYAKSIIKEVYNNGLNDIVVVKHNKCEYEYKLNKNKLILIDETDNKIIEPIINITNNKIIAYIDKITEPLPF